MDAVRNLGNTEPLRYDGNRSMFARNTERTIKDASKKSDCKGTVRNGHAVLGRIFRI